MLEDIQAAVPLGFFLSFMVGPVFFVLLQTSAVKGFRAAITFDLGVLFADVLFILVAYFSSFQLLENLSNQPGLYVFGGVILLVYGLV
ncbi:LysE family transporter, partial [Maribacter dokdonensis]